MEGDLFPEVDQLSEPESGYDYFNEHCLQCGHHRHYHAGWDMQCWFVDFDAVECECDMLLL